MSTAPDAGSAGPPRRGRRRRRRVLLLVVVPLLLLASVGVLEFLLRTPLFATLGLEDQSRGMFAVDAEGLLCNVPHWRGGLLGDGRTIPLRLNDLGLRGPDLGPPRPDERRVLVLGDSFVFGLDVHEHETLSARLGERLAAALPFPVTVGNGGMIGAGVADQRGLLRQVREVFAPDLIVSCVFLGNDFVDDGSRPWAIVQGHRFPGPMARSAQDSWRFQLALRFRVLALVERLLLQHVPTWALALGGTPTAEELAFEASLPPLAQREAGLFVDRRQVTPGVTAALERIGHGLLGVRELAGETPMLVVLIPTWFHVAPSLWRRCLREVGLDPAEHERGATQRRLTELIGGLGLPVIDLTPALAKHPRPDSLYQPGLLHWTAAGHAVAAEALEPQVRALLAASR